MTNENTQTESIRLIRCYIENESYGLDMSRVHSIHRTDRMRPDGRSEDASSDDSLHSEGHVEDLAGWLDVEGRETPVYNLGSRLGRSLEYTIPLGTNAPGGDLQRVVVLHSPESVEGHSGEGLSALLVDRVSQVIQIPMDLVVPLPSIVLDPHRNYFEGVIWLPEEMVLLLSIENLLSNTTPHTSSKEDHAQAAIREIATDDGVQQVDKLARFEPGFDDKHFSPGQIVAFNLSERFQGWETLSFGLSISQVPEILETLPMIQVPGAPAFVLGLLRWRDRPVPLIDLAGRLNVRVEKGPSTNGNRRLIVVRDRTSNFQPSAPPSGAYKDGDAENQHGKGILAAFIIQPNVRILRLPIACQPYVEELPFERAMTRGVVTTESEMLVIPDVQSVLRRES